MVPDARMRSHTVDIDSRGTLAATILMGVIGPCVFIVQPGFVQGLVAELGYSESRAGDIAAIEMWGIALTTVVMTTFAGRFDWRQASLVSLLVMAASNLACLVLTDPVAFATLRFLAGIGAGTVISLSFTIVGLTARPDRNFGLYIMFVLLYGALVLPAMPVTFDLVGFDGILVFFALLALAGVPFVRALPASGAAHVGAADGAVDLALRHRVLALGAMFAYFLGMGIVWAYLFLIGVAGGVSEQGVANALALSQIGGVAGALTTVVLAERVGRSLPLVVGILGTAAPVLCLLAGFEFFGYAAIVVTFNYAWNLTHPYLLGAMAGFDKAGRMVTYAVAAQMMGLANGPWIAARLIGGGEYSAVIVTGAALFVVSLAYILPALARHRAQQSVAVPGQTAAPV